MTGCIFCRIIAGEIPSATVYNDPDVVAFLDISPVQKGHVLVVPKKHCENILDADERTYLAVMQAVKKIAPAVKKTTNADALNISSNNGAAAGQVVMHYHWHIIPRFTADGLKHWPQHQYAEGEMNRFQEQIRGQLE